VYISLQALSRNKYLCSEFIIFSFICTQYLVKVHNSQRIHIGETSKY
jgi:hypothetical protein